MVRDKQPLNKKTGLKGVQAGLAYNNKEGC